MPCDSASFNLHAPEDLPGFCVFLSKRKIIKKGWKIVLIPLTVLFLLLSGLYLAIQSPGVQTFLTHRLADYFSEKLNAGIHIGGVDVALFNKVVLEDVRLEEPNGETLAAASKIEVRLDRLSLSNKEVGIGRFTIDRSDFYIRRDSLGHFNFDFLTDSLRKDTTSQNKWTFTCRNFRLRNSGFHYENRHGEPLTYGIDDINLRIDHFGLTPDSLAMKIASMTMIDSRGFFLNNLSADISQSKGVLKVSHLTVETLHSAIDSAQFRLESDTLPGTGEQRTRMALDLEQARLSLADVALFVAPLRGMDQVVEVSGNFSGSPTSIKARNLLITTGNNTLLDCDLSVDRFDDIAEPYLFLDINRLQTSLADLSRVRLPEGSKNSYLSFPPTLLESGTLSYAGNFTGFPTDFVAFGTLNSPMGQVRTDISFVPVNGNNIRYNGKLETSGFELGRLLKTDEIGPLSFNGMVNGLYNKSRESLNGNFRGGISELVAHGTTYRNIELDGNLNNRRFNGNVKINDDALKLDFTGLLDLDKKVPVFDFTLNLGQADLVAMHLDTANQTSRLRLAMTANFAGDNLDNLDGSIKVSDGWYHNDHDTLTFGKLTVDTHLGDEISQIQLYSDFFDLSVNGTYHFRNLFESFAIVMARYLPALKIPVTGKENTNRFAFDFYARNLNELAAVFVPGLQVRTPFMLSGRIDSGERSLEMKSEIPEIIYNKMAVRKVALNVEPADGELSARLRFGEFHMQNGLSLYNLALLADASDDRVDSRIVWNNWDNLSYSGEIAGELHFTTRDSLRGPVIDVALRPSKIIIADSVWQLSPAALRIDGKHLAVKGFSFRNGDQAIALDGALSTDENEAITLQLQHLNLGQLETYLKAKLGLAGMINGSLSVSDFYRSRRLDSDLRIDGLVFREQPIGDISLVNAWDRRAEQINSKMKITKNGRDQTVATGWFDPRTLDLDFTFDFNNQSLVVLNTVIRETLTNFHGDGSGRIRVHGKPGKLLMDGAVMCSNAGLTIDYTQVSYNLNDSVRLDRDRIIFRNMEVKDILGNRGTFNGTIRHDNFRNMRYDLSVNTNKILALNTTARQGESFYGKAIVRGNITITGQGTSVKLAGEATSLPETAVTIVLSEEAEVARYDFVRFVTAEKDSVIKPLFVQSPETGGLEIDFLMHATPEARVQMVYNTQISDEIRAQGEGTLRFRMDPKGNIFLTGDFVLEQGEYLFTVQNVINKRFTVEPGGSITWSGDPMQAVIDLNAIYSLRASLYELMVGTNENVTSSTRVPVECRIILTGDLTSPDIKFDILFPELESRVRDEVQQYFSTQEDLNRQMLSLLVLGKFYTPENVRGNYEATATGLIGSTASDLFSNGLSNWLSQINKDVDIGFNYRPGNQITGDEIELALSTQIFNDRVSINGNIGNNTNPRTMNQSELVGDFEINVKLTRNGKLQLKAYNKSNNNLIYETAPYTQGLGFSYKENYNHFEELWRNFLALFGKK